jgi:iron(III) transport system permease protein
VGARLRSLSPFSTASGLLAAILVVLGIYPLVRVIGRLFWDGGLTLEPFSQTFDEPQLPRLLLNTVTIVVVSGCLALFIGSVFAWLNERTDARMGVISDTMPLVTFLLPSIAGAVGWVLLLAPRAGYLNWFIRVSLDKVGVHIQEGPLNAYSWYGVILVYTTNLVPFAFLLVSSGLRNMDPALEEQSRMCGASLARTLRTVTLPAVRPSLAGAAFLMIWIGTGMFSVPVILAEPAGIDVLSVRIVRLLSFSYPARIGPAVGLGCFTMLALGITWYFQRKMLAKQRFGTIGGKGPRASRIELGHWRGAVRGMMILYMFVAIVLPIAALVLVSLNGFWTLNIDWGGLSLDAFRRTITDDPITWRALQNSVRLAAFTATLGMLAAAAVALWVYRSRSRSARVLDGAIKFPATVSNTVIAIGFILAFAGPPFSLGGTLIILLLAYLVLSMPEASVVADASVGQIGHELSEASFSSGAGQARTFRKVYLPLMLPGLVAGWALLFVRVVGDVNSSAILSGTNNVVVGFRILEINQNGSYARLAALALTLTLTSALILIVMLRISRRLSKWTKTQPTTVVGK